MKKDLFNSDRPGFLSGNLREWFGDIDIYVFDLVLKGLLVPGMRLLDVGCGPGRNLAYFLRTGCDVFGIDPSQDAIDEVRALASRLAPHLHTDNFRSESLPRLSFKDSYFDAVIAIAVLHFAEDDDAFERMVDEIWRVVKPGGLLFARLASSIGIEDKIQPLGGNRFYLPDGSERYLVDEKGIINTSGRLKGEFIEPIKTVNVDNQRCMTNWCLRKPA